MMNVDWGHRAGGGHDAASPRALGTDPVFPQRDEFLDDAVLLRHLRAAAPHLDIMPGVETVNVWYIPARSLQLVFRVRLRNRVEPAIIRLRFHPRREAYAAWLEARATATVQERVSYLPDWSAVAWEFPEDPGIPHLARLVDPAVLARQVITHGEPPAGPTGQIDVLSYLPGRRCAVRYRPAGTDRAFVVRMQGGGAAPESYRLASETWHAATRAFRMPRPLGFDGHAGMFWEEYVPGRRIDALMGVVPVATILERIVQDLVLLHALPATDLPANGGTEVLARTIGKAVPKLRLALPELAGDIDDLSGRLAAGLHAGGAQTPVTLHGDLHTANVLLDERGAIFIDLDRLACGDPAYDLALLGGRLLAVALHRKDHLAETAAAVATLPEMYRRACGQPLREDVFAWYMAALLIGRQLKTLVRHLAPGAAGTAVTLVAWARQTIEDGIFTDTLPIGD